MTVKRRDFATEIESKKSRLFRSDRWELIRLNLKWLNHAMKVLEMWEENISFFEEKYKEHLKGQEEELFNYFPIRCIACIEGYMRLVYSYLVDYGHPFRENAKKFDIKFGLDTAISLDSKSIPLGDFVAHLLPGSSFDDINKNMSTLIGEDFIKLCWEMFLKKPRQKGFFGTDEEDFANMLKGIQNMFSVRHILCHEIGYAAQKEIYHPSNYIGNTLTFLSIIEAVINEVAPPTGNAGVAGPKD